jgi:hypothetical protein
MKQPLNSPARLAGPTKTMFYTEGNSAASLVTNKAGRHQARTMKFTTAEAALGWCRKNATMLVYFPFNLAHN